MSLYDDAGMISLPTGAAGKDNKLYNIKPVEKLKAEELITNGTFEDNDSEAAWLKVNSPTISGNQVRITDRVDDLPVRIYQTGVLEGGKTYRLSINVIEVKSGELRIGTGYSSNKVTGSNPISTPGNHSFVFLNSSGEDDEDWIFIRAEDEDSDYDITFDNISVKEVEQEAKDFGFVRASSLSATRVGPGGLIEKGRENLFTYSNDFRRSQVSSAPWGHAGLQSFYGPENSPDQVPSGGADGYDKSGDASFFVLSTSDSRHEITLSQTVEGVQTISIYAKAGGYDFLFIRTQSANNEAFFNLSTGSVGTTASSVVEAKMEDVGSDWYRCSMTVVGSFTSVAFGAAAQDNVKSFAGDGSGGIYIMNAQREMGVVATDYIYSNDTTGKAGILEDEPRFDHTGGGCPGLLLESQSINLVPYSEYFTFEGRTTITRNHGTSPEGVKNSTKFTNTTETGAHRTYTDTFDVTSGDTYTASVFAKKGSLKKLSFKIMASNESDIGFDEPIFNLDDETIGGDSSNASMVDYGNGWYRCIVTSSPTSTPSDARVYFYFREDDDTKSYTGTTSQNMEIYGAQVEESSFVTSYIPNHGTSGGATRVRDDVGVITDTTTDGLTNGYNTTIYCKFKLLADDRPTISGLVNYYPPVTGIQNDPRLLLYTGGSSEGTFKARLQYRMGNTGDNDQIIETPGSYNVGDEVKVIGRITDYDITLFVNGTKFTFADHPTTATAGRAFKKSISGATMNALDLTYSTTAAHHELYEVITFPKALTDDECEDLTTL